jgi:hypothetical protein
MNRAWWLVLLVVTGSLANAQGIGERYALLRDLQSNGRVWSAQADFVDLLEPRVAVSRGSIPASDAVHYARVFSNQNAQLRRVTFTGNVRVSLLTYPELRPRTATMTNLKQLLEFSENLPQAFEHINGSSFNDLLLLKFTKGGLVSSVEQINLRRLTGVYVQPALIGKASSFVVPERFVLDFVELLTSDRELRRFGLTMNNDAPSGIYIRNANPQLRSFSLARGARVRLLKNAGAYFIATPAQLEAGLRGRDYGWRFAWDTPFNALISDVTGQILELKQQYLP